MTSNAAVCAAFAEHEVARTKHLYTDGNIIYSYGEHFPIGIWDGDIVLITKDKYSSTTSHHQTNLRQALIEHGIPYKRVPLRQIQNMIDNLNNVKMYA